MNNILLGRKIKSDDKLSCQQGSQPINQTNVIYGNGGLNTQQQTIQTTPLANFNAVIDQNQCIQDVYSWVLDFLKKTLDNSGNETREFINSLKILIENFDLIDNERIKKLYSEGEKCEQEGANINDIENLRIYIINMANNVSYIQNTISFIKNNKNLLNANSIGFLNNVLKTRTNIEYAVVSVADLIWVRKKFNENQNRKDIVLRYLEDRKDAAFYPQNIKNNITIILGNINLLTGESINYLLQMLLTQISRTTKGDAISEIAKSILRTKVLSALEANKTNEGLPMDTRNAIVSILQNINLLNTDILGYLYEAFYQPTANITTVSYDISKVEELISIFNRNKVLSALAANKTNEIFPLEIRNAINFILHNQNLKIGNLNLLGSDKINSLFSVIFTPNFTIADTFNTIKSVADSISKSKWLFIFKALEALKNSNHFGSEENIAESVKILQENSNLIDYRDIDTLYVYSKNLKLAIASNKEEKIKSACENLANHAVDTTFEVKKQKTLSLLRAYKNQGIVNNDINIILQNKNPLITNSISDLSFKVEGESEELKGTVENNINIILQNENLLNSYSINDLCSALIAKNNNRKIDSIKKSAETVVWRLLNEEK